MVGVVSKTDFFGQKDPKIAWNRFLVGCCFDHRLFFTESGHVVVKSGHVKIPLF